MLEYTTRALKSKGKSGICPFPAFRRVPVPMADKSMDISLVPQLHTMRARAARGLVLPIIPHGFHTVRDILDPSSYSVANLSLTKDTLSHAVF